MHLRFGSILLFILIIVGQTPVTDGAKACPGARQKTTTFANASVVKESKKINVVEKKSDLCERLFEFAEMVKEFLITIPSSPEYRIIITHLSKSASSLSACNNYEKSVSSITDFSHDPEISLRYLRELDCWLRITKRHIKEINTSDLEYLLKESGELKSILDTIVQKS